MSGRQEDAGEEVCHAGSHQGAKMAAIFAVGTSILAAADAVIVRTLNGAVHPLVIGCRAIRKSYIRLNEFH